MALTGFRYSAAKLGDCCKDLQLFAIDSFLSKEVIIKRIDNIYNKLGFTLDVMKELTVLDSLRSANVAALYDIEMMDDTIFIITEKCQGNLYDAIYSDRCGELTSPKILLIMAQVLEGLAHIHRSRIILGDLDPTNILLSNSPDGNPVAKISNFESCMLHSNKNSEIKIPVGTKSDTFWYTAPEIILMCGPVSFSQDIWSAGCVFAELIRRSPLFNGSSRKNQLIKICSYIGYDIVNSNTTIQNISDGKNLIRLLTQIQATNEARSGEDHHFLRNALPNADDTHPLCISLLSNMLCINPMKRISSSTGMNHTIFRTIRSVSTNVQRSLSMTSTSELADDLRTLSTMPREKDVVRQYLQSEFEELKNRLMLLQDLPCGPKRSSATSTSSETDVSESGISCLNDLFTSHEEGYNRLREQLGYCSMTNTTTNTPSTHDNLDITTTSTYTNSHIKRSRKGSTDIQNDNDNDNELIFRKIQINDVPDPYSTEETGITSNMSGLAMMKPSSTSAKSRMPMPGLVRQLSQGLSQFVSNSNSNNNTKDNNNTIANPSPFRKGMSLRRLIVPTNDNDDKDDKDDNINDTDPITPKLNRSLSKILGDIIDKDKNESRKSSTLSIFIGDDCKEDDNDEKSNDSDHSTSNHINFGRKSPNSTVQQKLQHQVLPILKNNKNNYTNDNNNDESKDSTSTSTTIPYKSSTSVKFASLIETSELQGDSSTSSEPYGSPVPTKRAGRSASTSTTTTSSNSNSNSNNNNPNPNQIITMAPTNTNTNAVRKSSFKSSSSPSSLVTMSPLQRALSSTRMCDSPVRLTPVQEHFIT
eukprot:gene2593-5069_t